MSVPTRLRNLEEETTPSREACVTCRVLGGVVLVSECRAAMRGRCPRCGGPLPDGYRYVPLPDLRAA